jgi:hypothetical protein
MSFNPNDVETPVSSKKKPIDKTNLAEALMDRLDDMETALSCKINTISMQLHALVEWQKIVDDKIKNMEKKVSNSDNRMSVIEMDLENLKLKTNIDINLVAAKAKELIEIPTVDATSFSKSMRDKVHEHQRRAEKKCNIVVYGMIEVTEFRQEVKAVENLMHDCSPSTQIKPKNIKRLGKPRNPGERPRPMLIEFNSVQDKKTILGAQSYLRTRNMYKNISLSPDFTVCQREERRKYAMERAGQNPNRPLLRQSQHYQSQTQGQY